MKLRLQADADLNQRIVAGIWRLEPAIDLHAAGQAMFEGKADPEVLAYCANQGRTLLTHDQKTMPHHFATFIAERSSPGVSSSRKICRLVRWCRSCIWLGRPAKPKNGSMASAACRYNRAGRIMRNPSFAKTRTARA